MFRVIVQESRMSPTSGKVVAQLGHYDPHTKAVTVDTEKASLFLKNGAQPSDRVARLLQKEGVKLPDWVELSGQRNRTAKNAEKLRKNQPKDDVKDEPEAPADDAPAEPATDAPAEEAAADTTVEEKTTEEAPTEDPAAEVKEEAKTEA